MITPMLWMLMIRLLQPFNVANTSIMRIFRKVYVSTIWNTIRIPLELGIFVLLMQWTLPMTAFVIAVLLHQLGAFSMNWYVYGVLLRDRSFPRK